MINLDSLLIEHHRCKLLQVSKIENQIQHGIEMHARLAADRPDVNPKAAVQKRLQRLGLEEADLGMGQAKLLEEIKLAILKREALFLKVKRFAFQL